MLSTGSPLVPESFDYIYEAIKRDLHLASISGGTDICGCFVLGIPTKPVWRGEIQGPALGLAVDVVDETGAPVEHGKGELVCTQAVPVDAGRLLERSRRQEISRRLLRPLSQHLASRRLRRMDRARRHDHPRPLGCHAQSGRGAHRHGRDLPPGRAARRRCRKPIVIGQDWDGDVRVVLFVVLKPGVELDDALRERIKKQIRVGASPRHVPARIVQVADIPRTKSGKITELAVRDVVHGREVKNKEALANPEALALYQGIAELAS